MAIRKYLNDFVTAPNKVTWSLSKLIILFHLNPSFIRFKISNDVKMHLHPSKWSILLLNPKFKVEEKTFYQRFLRKGESFIDVGANVGLFTLIAASAVGDSGHVYSFEANPNVFRLLIENVALNSFGEIVSCHNCALSDSQGNAEFFVRKYGDDLGSLSRQAHDGQAEIQVRMERGDSVLPAGETFTLLKIDVEGAEFKVLTGLGERLRQVKFLMFENDPALFECFGVTFVMIWELLHQYGFDIYKAKPGGLVALEKSYAAREYDNLFAFRASDLQEFHRRTDESYR